MGGLSLEQMNIYDLEEMYEDTRDRILKKIEKSYPMKRDREHFKRGEKQRVRNHKNEDGSRNRHQKKNVKNIFWSSLKD